MSILSSELHHLLLNEYYQEQVVTVRNIPTLTYKNQIKKLKEEDSCSVLRCLNNTRKHVLTCSGYSNACALQITSVK